MPSRVHTAILASILSMVLTCSADAGELSVREYVDEVTAASITVPAVSLVFARERADLAANSRDYISLVPVEVNRTGQRAYFWSGYVWSTIDRRGREPVLASNESLVLIADGRPIALRMASATRQAHGLGQSPTRAPTRIAQAVLFNANPEEIAYVAHAYELHVAVVRESRPGGEDDSFRLWKPARRGLIDFTEKLQLGR